MLTSPTPTPVNCKELSRCANAWKIRNVYIPPSYPKKVPCVASSMCATAINDAPPTPPTLELQTPRPSVAPGSNYMTAPKPKCLASFSVLNFQTFRPTGIHQFQWTFFSKPLLKFTFPNKNFVEGLG